MRACAAIVNALGGVVEWIDVHDDVSERVTLRIALPESRERFQRIVSQAATSVVEMDVEGRITLVNGRSCQIPG